MTKTTASSSASQSDDADVNSETPVNSHTALAHLTQRETREIVTPYAFGVAEALIGQPLASPMRRLLAQGIDFSIIVLLSMAHAFILACVVAVTFFTAGSHLAKGTKRKTARSFLRLSAAGLLFLVTYGLVDGYSAAPDQDKPPKDTTQQLATAGIVVAQQVAWHACDADMTCYREWATDFGDVLAETNITREECDQLINTFFTDKSVSDDAKAELTARYVEAFQLRRSQRVISTPDSGSHSVESDDNQISPSQTEFGLGNDNNIARSNSIISWIEAIIRDLGLGFGWAAIYYSVLTAWWRGHTVGKKLLRVKVVKLDGSPLNLWESFGRYGGYTAGLATGLLGFVQVYWDPNRQTIQDKIAETLVLYRPKGAKPIPQLLEESEHEVS